jgi:hypothetical protein
MSHGILSEALLDDRPVLVSKAPKVERHKLSLLAPLIGAS